MKKNDLPDIVETELRALGGSSTILEICKRVWSKYESELKQSGDLFYTWQYDIRWAATSLRKQGIMKGADASPKGTWELA